MATLKRQASPTGFDSFRAAPHFPRRSLTGSQIAPTSLSGNETKAIQGEVPNCSQLSRAVSPSKFQRILEPAPSLSPSPKFSEPVNYFKDKPPTISIPLAPRRNNLPTIGLSLQMPALNFTSPSTTSLINCVPLSPKLEASHSYSAPSVLPRRSRGLDFSRACTNLHHSTLAEKSSPDSSPTVSGRELMNAARLKLGFHNSSSFEPALGGTNALWATAKNSEKAGIPGSLGSINMLDSDSQETSSDDDDQLDHDDSEDPIVTTPQVYKLSTYGLPSSTTSNFASTVSASPGGEWMKENSAFAASLMSFQRARLGNRKLRKKSSCASVGGGSSLASLNLASQPPFRSAETMNGSFFTKDLKNHCYTSRRESLSTGTKELHISSGGDESDENRVTAKLDGSSKSSQPGRDEKKGVIRRVVTRRGNMLPKSKNFARIRAALIEETSIIDTETRHEAEAIRQIRDSDSALDSGLFKSSQHSTIEQSPALLPTEPVPTLFEDISSNEALPGGSSLTRNQEVIHTNFSQQALQNSGGKVFWDSFDARTSTPPPQSIQQRKSSAFSEDIIMGSPSLATTRSSISSATFNGNINSNQFQSSAFDLSRKVTKKRQRDNDLDPSSFKRRAVSPGVSLQNSPILAQSPGQKDGGWWGFQAGFEGGQPSSCFQPLGDRNNFATGVVGASSNSGSKRVGFQGISDTNSGLMNMSIE